MSLVKSDPCSAVEVDHNAVNSGSGDRRTRHNRVNIRKDHFCPSPQARRLHPWGLAPGHFMGIVFANCHSGDGATACCGSDWKAAAKPESDGLSTFSRATRLQAALASRRSRRWNRRLAHRRRPVNGGLLQKVCGPSIQSLQTERTMMLQPYLDARRHRLLPGTDAPIRPRTSARVG